MSKRTKKKSDEVQKETGAGSQEPGAENAAVATQEQTDAPIGEGVQVRGETVEGAKLPPVATEAVADAAPAGADEVPPAPHDPVQAARETLERVCKALSSGDAPISGYVSRSPSPRLTARQGQTLTRIAVVLGCKRDQAVGQLLDLIADVSMER